ncbi:BlaI/MecI/CopY family transcriptional regulator [Paenibacillus psychroresistens]|uniref:BlaI/MecI/CopY family transcriptional regulator n=1 Tax=Paenibacillus psychroresistens TaxID=1778678 RepID=UPI001D049A05|nr:BlaI/MecI/CopY family transcriptional regulator [Paenibacillus psychroresistens]
MKIIKYKMYEAGLNRFFGPLESKVMELIWAYNKVTIKTIQDSLNKDNNLSFNAIMTVMNRLNEKGHLHKKSLGSGRSKLTFYEPIQTKEQFIEEQTREVTHGLVYEFGDLVLNQMIEALEDTDPGLIAKLEQKIEDLRRRITP